MSFNIKQYRGTEPYWDTIQGYSLGYVTTSFPYLANTYKDSCIEMSFQKGIPYYLSIKIEKEKGENSQNREITVQLQNDLIENFSSTENQTISKIQLLRSTSEEDAFEIFHFIFTPSKNYNKISFIISRDLKNLEDWEKYAKIEVNKFQKLNNLLSLLQISQINQLGIHADPGTLMCINGEEIKIGKRGVFEINSNIVQINFLNIINLKENSYYTIDCRYTKEDAN